MIRYTESLDGIRPEQLSGFFDGWPSPPSPETHLDILRESHAMVLAIDEETDRAVGFVTAISDGILAAYIPLLEVLPSHRGRGIGRELMKRMLDSLNGLYMIDLVCDSERQPFYSSLGMKPAPAMVVRRYKHQSGRKPT